VGYSGGGKGIMRETTRDLNRKTSYTSEVLPLIHLAWTSYRHESPKTHIHRF